MEFQPTDAAQVRSTAEVEDGEVNDSKTSGTAQPTSNGLKQSQNETNSAPARPSLPVRDAAKASAPRSGPPSAAPSNPGTPKPTASVPVSGSGNRNDQGRTSTLPAGSNSLPSRPELPRKPNVPLPSSVSVDQFGQIRNHERRDGPQPREARDPRDHREGPRDTRDQQPRDNREPHGPRDGRDYRPSDAPRPDRPREYAGPDRRGPEPAPREPARSSRPDPPRWNDDGPPPPERESRPARERPQPPVRDARPSRDSRVVTPPPAPVPASQSVDLQDPPINPDRARLLAEIDRPDQVNPARAALIGDPREPRSARDATRDRPLRNESPRRGDQPGPGTPQADGSRDDRHGRHRHSDYSRDSYGENGPHTRGDRGTERDMDRGPSDKRDSSSFNGPPRDEQHGRLNQQDPNYGRLNNPIQSVVGDTPPGPPSGPRGRGRNAARISSMNNRPDGRFPGPDPLRPPSPERIQHTGPPTGPSSSRQRRGQYDGGNSISPTQGPPPQSLPPPTAPGMHPDRMRHIGHQTPQGSPSGVHPDRMNQISGTNQFPRQSMSTPDRPATGPRPGSSGAINTPGSDLPSGHATPTGPAGGDSRMRPGGRQLRGIQSTLERASSDGGRSSRGSQGRGSSRMNLPNSDVQVLTGASPVTTPVQERADPMRIDSGRRDVQPDRAPIPTVGDSRDGRNGDDYGSSNRGDQERGRREHHRSERSRRPSGRGSRERSAERDPGSKEPREYRDRREGPPPPGPPTGGRDGDRESGTPRRSNRESSTNNRESHGDREGSHRGHRSDIPRPDGPAGRNDMPPIGRGENHGARRDRPPSGGGDEYGGGGGGGRHGPPRGAGGPPRDSRMRTDDRGDRREDRGRKRRSDVEPNGDRMDNKRPRP